MIFEFTTGFVMVWSKTIWKPQSWSQDATFSDSPLSLRHTVQLDPAPWHILTDSGWHWTPGHLDCGFHWKDLKLEPTFISFISCISFMICTCFRQFADNCEGMLQADSSLTCQTIYPWNMHIGLSRIDSGLLKVSANESAEPFQNCGLVNASALIWQVPI